MSNQLNRAGRIFSRIALPRRAAVLFALAASLTGCAANAQRLVVTPDRADTVYQPGQTVHWTIRWNGPDAPSSVDYVLKRGGLTEAGRGSLTLKDGAAELDSKLETPGTVLLEVKAKGADAKEIRALGGAVAAPEKIAPSAPRPADFDAFWAAKLKELATVPVEPQLQEVQVEKPGVSYWKITMNNIRGSHIRGQIARPTGTGKLPALLIVQWAGVYPLQRAWVTDRAKEGWLALNIEAHDLPIDEPESFYREQAAGPLNNYPAIGNEDRDTSYFLRMYLSCYRAAEYLTHRPDWDGKTLVVMGGSQGGLQALMTAGFHPKITAALAEVPAGCDMLGPEAGRAPGWPMWYWQTKGKDEKRVREASRYYDVVNFASRIKCPVLIGAGMIDETCPPAGILAAANQITSPKEVILLPRAPHQDEYRSHAPYAARCWSAWLPALREGRPAPVQPTYNAAGR